MSKARPRFNEAFFNAFKRGSIGLACVVDFSDLSYCFFLADDRLEMVKGREDMEDVETLASGFDLTDLVGTDSLSKVRIDDLSDRKLTSHKLMLNSFLVGSVWVSREKATS